MDRIFFKLSDMHLIFMYCVDNVRDSVAKTMELLNRQRVCELVELQQNAASSAQSVSFANEAEGKDLPRISGDRYNEAHHSNSYSSSNYAQNTTGSWSYQGGVELDSEIAMIARRIRDRLMMPSTTTASSTSSA